MGNVIWRLELFSALNSGSFTKKKKEMGLTTVDVIRATGRSARRLCGSFMFGGKSDKKYLER
ncbi:unnamed protein product [Lepidochelys kempii]